MKKTRLGAAFRLRAYSSPIAKELIKGVEGLLNSHGIARDPNSSQYPRRYIKKAPESLFDTVKKEFEQSGFKFKKSALHKMDTKAVESDGRYQSLHYILDLAYRDGVLEVELHH